MENIKKIDYKQLLIKYVNHIYQVQDKDFLHNYDSKESNVKFTEKEKEYLNSL